MASISCYCRPDEPTIANREAARTRIGIEWSSGGRSDKRIERQFDNAGSRRRCGFGQGFPGSQRASCAVSCRQGARGQCHAD